MAELQVINTLDAKRKEIEAYIGSLERDLEQARRDLSAILAAVRVFEAKGVKITPYMTISRLFPRHELPKRAWEILEAHPDGITTPDLARLVMIAKGMDTTDRHLCGSITYKAVQVLRMWEKRGRVVRLGKVKGKGVIVWQQSEQ